jgi:hypothetical protein
MNQRWNDLLLAHWPIPAQTLAPLLPEWLSIDTFEGSAWLGAVPFWLDRIKIRGIPALPGFRGFPDLNLRTYVRDQYTGTPGIYSFSLDSSNLFAVAVARTFYHLPSHWAEMHLDQRSEREFDFYSRRRFSSQSVLFAARYRGLGPTHKTALMQPGTLEAFFTDRSCLFSCNRAGQPIRASMHFLPMPLEEAEAEIEHNELAAAIGIQLPACDPILHYSRRLGVYIWPSELLRSVTVRRPIAAVASPTG